jgi:ribosomal protein S18 acetylase RimI-like enzyme
MNIIPRLAKESNLDDYRDLLQETYQATYVDESIGLTKECFSKEVFSSQDTTEYLKGNLIVDDEQKTWLAYDGELLVGVITIKSTGDECELKGFYVKPKYQGKGIGNRLWKKALGFANGKDILFLIFTLITKKR